MKEILYKTINFIYPPHCLLCNNMVEMQGVICQNCWPKINFISNPLCDACGLPFEYDLGKGVLCGKCIAAKPSYDKARAVFIYDDESRKLITEFKYGDKIHNAKIFANWVKKLMHDNSLSNADIITSVPLHKMKLFLRRYNQAALVANHLGELCTLPVYNKLLVRKKYTKSQTGLTKNQRKENVSSAFKLNDQYKSTIKGKNILLIDDVMTTGATVEACAKQLVKNGAKSVYVLTIARTNV